ncbi:hypothetical protein E2320_022160, partial [Naja naja]
MAVRGCKRPGELWRWLREATRGPGSPRYGRLLQKQFGLRSIWMVSGSMQSNTNSEIMGHKKRFLSLEQAKGGERNIFLWPMISLLVLLWMLPEAIQMDLRPNCFWRRPFEEQKDYYSAGDLIIGGNLPLSITVVLQLLFHEPPAEWDVLSVYKIVGTKVQNRIPCWSRWSEVNNKKYRYHFPCLTSSFSSISTLPQLGYRFSDPDLRDKTQFPTFYQIDPQYHLQNTAIVQLLLYFQWNWIGVVVQKSESSDHFIRIFDATLAQNDICIQFVKQIIPIFPIFKILHKDQIDVLWTILNSDAQTKPFSRCVKCCLPGQTRKVEEGRPSCCYGYAARCDPCPEDKYPNKDKDHCIAKKIHFLTYQDTMGYMDLRPNCFWRRPLEEQKDYYSPGDLIIGGNLPLSIFVVLQQPNEPPAEWLGYRFSHPVLRDKSQFPTFYQIDPQYHLQNVAIFHLLLYFQWNWIGMVVQRSESSDHFIQIFNATLAQNDICIQFVKQIVPQISMFNVLPGNLRYVLWTILNSDADVVIVSGDSNSLQ